MLRNGSLAFIIFILNFTFSVEAQNSQNSLNSQNHTLPTIESVFRKSEQIPGRKQYLESPYNTAGDRLYMVGYQDGSFPDIGWHVTGEMGGIWSHPIKLLDGFNTYLTIDGNRFALKADSFINYPFGNRHIYNISDNISVERYQFVPDGKSGVCLEYVLKNKSHVKINIEVELEATSNLMPVWLGDRTGMIDGKDQSAFDPEKNVWIAKDSLNTWFAVYGSTIKAKDDRNKVGDSTKTKRTGNSKPGKPNTSVTKTSYAIEILPGASFRFPLAITGSLESQSEAIRIFEDITHNAVRLLIEKEKRLAAIANKTKLTLSDKKLETAFRWIKYNNDWLIVNVPGRGRAISAGLPDYPWWFGGDMAYTLKGLIATGQKDLVYSSIDLIHEISEKTNGNGRIVHEVSTNGAVYNPGNVNETAQFVSLVWDVFCWTGDMAFLRKYFPAIQKGLNWLIKDNDKDGNLLPDGSGMMEIHGLTSEMIDVAAYTQKAFDDAAQMATIVGDKQLFREYQRIADAIRTKINKEFWVEDFGSYADFIGTKEQAMQLANDAIVRADTLKKPWAVTELKRTKEKITADTSNARKGFVMHHNWVVNTPMEMGIADSAKAIIALETAKKFTNPFGMFVTGIDRDATAGTDDGSFAAMANKRAFTYTGAVMTLPTGFQAVAENNYGRPDQAYLLLQKMLATFSYALPGSIYEVSPDFGMMTQAWNLYAFGEPIIKQLFGIRPHAYKKQINLSPLLPSSLEHGKVENVEINDNAITVSFQQGTKENVFDISLKRKGWRLVFAQPKGKFGQWILNGKTIKPESNGNMEQVILTRTLAHLVLIR